MIFFRVLLGVFLIVETLMAQRVIPFKSQGPVVDYGGHFLSVSGNALMLYNKDLDLQRESEKKELVFSTLSVAFDQGYVLDNAHAFRQFSLMDMIDIAVDDSQAYHAFDVRFPSVLLLTKSSRLMSKQLQTGTLYWEKELFCESIQWVSSGAYAGCLTGATLTLLDAISGDVVFEQALESGEWAFVSSWNRGVVVSKDGQFFYQLDLKSGSFTALELGMDAVMGWVRQKEVIGGGAESLMLSCTDIESKTSRWMTFFEQPYEDVMVHQDYVLLQFPSDNYKIIQHFDGKEVASLTLPELELFPTLFYRFKQYWYFFGQDSILKVKQGTDEDVIN